MRGRSLQGDDLVISPRGNGHRRSQACPFPSSRSDDDDVEEMNHTSCASLMPSTARSSRLRFAECCALSHRRPGWAVRRCADARRGVVGDVFSLARRSSCRRSWPPGSENRPRRARRRSVRVRPRTRARPPRGPGRASKPSDEATRGAGHPVVAITPAEDPTTRAYDAPVTSPPRHGSDDGTGSCTDRLVIWCA